MVRIKRAYAPTTRSDGYRVLVDRLWPRGLRKDAAHLAAWLKDIAPSDELRQTFGHDPARFGDFRKRYLRELRSSRARQELDQLAKRAARQTVTLVYAARDEEHNNAVVIAEALQRRLRELVDLVNDRKGQSLTSSTSSQRGHRPRGTARKT